MYSNHNNNIKCVDSTIKYIGFEPIDYVINLTALSSFMIFRILVICFYLCIASSNKLN